MEPKELGLHIDTRRIRKLVHGVHTAMLLLVVVTGYTAVSLHRTAAAPLGPRSITIDSARASESTTHTFSLTLTSLALVGSISFEYCQESPLFNFSCTTPPGLDASSMVLDSETGETGFSIHPSSNGNTVILTRPPAIASPGVASYEFDSITNPNSSNTTSFVRVATYATDDASGARTDEGGLAFSITEPLNVEAYVPPFIIMCVGVTVALNCSDASGSSLDLGDLNSSAPNAATSQFAVATNDESGYNAYILGTTMTSGTFSIPPNSSQQPSNPGSSHKYY